jgi:hypothetical protein
MPSKTIRNLLNNKSIQNNAHLYNTRNNIWQMMFVWNEKEGALENFKNRNRRLYVSGGQDVEGQHVHFSGKNGRPDQKWKLIYSDDMKGIKTKGTSDYGFEINKPFYFRSRMLFERVLTAQSNCNHIQIKKRQNPESTIGKKQLFYFDNVSKTIKLKGCPGRSVSGHGWIYMRPTNSRWFQMWKYDASRGHVKNVKNNHVFGVHGNHDHENRNIHWYSPNNHKSQQFDIIFEKEWPPEPKNGELHPKFGFIIGKKFMLQSALPAGRYLDTFNGSNLSIKTRNG